jgi:hypothetical protein
MTARPGDCEHCHAIAPGVGSIEHSPFCPRPPYQHHNAPLPDAPWIDAGMTPEQSRSALIALARRIEDAWAQRAARRIRLARMAEDMEITLPRARESAVSSNA